MWMRPFTTFVITLDELNPLVIIPWHLIKKTQTLMLKIILLTITLMLSACAGPGVDLLGEGRAKSNIEYSDFDKFDRDMQASVNSESINVVRVVFYEKYAPQDLPRRVQSWISSAETHSGVVSFKYPEGEEHSQSNSSVRQKLNRLLDQILNINLNIFNRTQHPIENRDVLIELNRTRAGELYIQRINFIKRGAALDSNQA